MSLSALVVGASIAGPTTAYWLARAGAKVTVIERFPLFRTSGQNVDIRSVGVTVMRRMHGMEERVQARKVQLDGMSYVRTDGRSYGTVRPTGDPDHQTLISEYEILRGDLAGVLYDMTKDNPNIKYVFGEQVSAIQQKEDSITVDFANGLESDTYDLVVACDGATSRTRALGLGGGVRDHVHPVNTWAAYFSVPRDLLDGSTVANAHSAVGGRFISLEPDPAGTRINMMGIHPRSLTDATRPFRDAQKDGDLGVKRFIRERFSGVGWRVPEALDCMDESKDFYASEWVQVKLPTIINSRFTLVGDAGYAAGPTGGGTSLAMCGAYVLAGEIGRHPDDLLAGLRAYENRMRPIIKDLQQVPPFVPGVMSPQTAWGIWVRNAIFSFIAWSGIVGFLSKYFANVFAEVDKYQIPVYEFER